MFGRYYEDFTIGDEYIHWPGKTITESDNNLFCLLTMNHHPVHIDEEYASKQQHGEILVVGTYVLSLVVGLSVADVSGLAIANLEYSKIQHLAPSFIGDTIYSKTIVIEKSESKSRNDRGIVEVETIAWNQDGENVLRLSRKILVPKKGL